MFRKNSMEFFVGLDYYLYYFTSGYILKSHGHKSFQNVLWSHDSSHVICLLKFPHYLYCDPIMHLDVVDQIVQMRGKLFSSWGSYNMKEEFIPKKKKVYSLSREEREEIQAFVENQLRKKYI